MSLQEWRFWLVFGGLGCAGWWDGVENLTGFGNLSGLLPEAKPQAEE